MEKQLKDYLHLYNNRFNPVKVIVDNEEQKYLWDIEVYEEDYVNITLGDTKLRDMEGNSDNWNVYNDNYSLDRIKPILRPLSDMKTKESQRWNMMAKSYQSYSATVKYFLDNHFDLFGLIEAGIAIDKTTLVA